MKSICQVCPCKTATLNSEGEKSLPIIFITFEEKKKKVGKYKVFSFILTMEALRGEIMGMTAQHVCIIPVFLHFWKGR